MELLLDSEKRFQEILLKSLKAGKVTNETRAIIERMELLLDSEKKYFAEKHMRDKNEINEFRKKAKAKPGPTSKHLIYESLTMNHLEMFNNLMAENQLVMPSDTLSRALAAINEGQDSKIITPTMSVQLPNFSNLPINGILKLRESPSFEKIREYVSEFVDSASPDKNGSVEMQDFQKEISNMAKEAAKKEIKLHPKLNKIVSSPGFYTSLAISTCSAISPDFKTFFDSLIISGPASFIGGALVASEVEQRVGKFFEKKREQSAGVSIIKSASVDEKLTTI